MDLLAGGAFADDEGLARKGFELDLSFAAETMGGRQHDEDPLRPELPALAARPICAAGYERDIELMLSDRGDVVGGVAIDEGEFDGRMLQPKASIRSDRNPDASDEKIPILIWPSSPLPI